MLLTLDGRMYKKKDEKDISKINVIHSIQKQVDKEIFHKSNWWIVWLLRYQIKREGNFKEILKKFLRNFFIIYFKCIIWYEYFFIKWNKLRPRFCQTNREFDIVEYSIISGSFYLQSNDLNVNYETKVLVIDSVFDQVNSGTESIFILDTGANLEIQNSTFNQISCTEIGGIIYSGYQNTKTNIYDSSFTNNTSIAGALFLIESGSYIKLYRWRIFQNFAITAGLIEVLSLITLK